MNVSRESVSVALFGLFTGLVGNGVANSTGSVVSGAPNGSAQPFALASRIYPTKANIEGGLLPALYLIEADENDDEAQGYKLQRYQLRYALRLYAQTPDDGVTAPGSVLNTLLDAVDKALQTSVDGYPLNGQPQRLAPLNQLPPLVQEVWISGRVFKSYSEVTPAINFVVLPLTAITGQ